MGPWFLNLGVSVCVGCVVGTYASVATRFSRFLSSAYFFGALSGIATFIIGAIIIFSRS